MRARRSRMSKCTHTRVQSIACCAQNRASMLQQMGRCSAHTYRAGTGVLAAKSRTCRVDSLGGVVLAVVEERTGTQREKESVSKRESESVQRRAAVWRGERKAANAFTSVYRRLCGPPTPPWRTQSQSATHLFAILRPSVQRGRRGEEGGCECCSVCLSGGKSVLPQAAGTQL